MFAPTDDTVHTNDIVVFITNLSSGYEVKSLAQRVHANLVQGHAHTNDIVWFHYKPILGIQNKVACTTCSCEFGAGGTPLLLLRAELDLFALEYHVCCSYCTHLAAH